jgi:hypothetical protein
MDNTPDDILRLVLESYVNDLGQSPANLLTVCRRWHHMLLSNPNVWSRLHINVTSFHTIPYILGKENKLHPKERNSTKRPAPLLAYLERSIPVKGMRGHPLDISIRWSKMNVTSYASDVKFYLQILFPDPPKGPQQFHGDMWGFYDEEYKDYYGLDDDDLDLYEADLNQHKHLCEIQMQELVTWLAGERSVEDLDHKTNVEAGNYAARWKSLFIDMTRVPCDECKDFEIYDINFGELKNPTLKRLQSLSSLRTHGAGFLISEGEKTRALELPSLKLLEVYYGAVWPQPKFDNIESLTMIECFASTHVKWEECKNLRFMRLKLHDPVTVFEHPSTHSFPHLTTIILENGFNLLNILTKLSKSFNKSRPLKLLVLAEHSIDIVYAMLHSAPLFHADMLKLSSHCSQGIGFTMWNWQKFGEEDWNINRNDVEHACKLLQELGDRGIPVEAMDKLMQEILTKARLQMKVST